MILVVIWPSMLSLCCSYRRVDSVFCCARCHWRGAVVWMMAYVARWSAILGAIVPDVIAAMDCVRTTSMSVAVLCLSSYLVGVVIVVYSPFRTRNCVNVSVGVRSRRLVLMSPWIVTMVFGHLVCISSSVFFSAWASSGLPVLGRLYVLMMVWIGLLVCAVACTWRMIVSELGMLMFSTRVTWRFYR